MLDPVRVCLGNGLTVIVLPRPHLHAVALSFMVRAGPRFETEAEQGLSHLVEHMVFRGTERYPSSFAINAAIEALGGEVNGYTQRDTMNIHLTVPPRAARAGLTLLGELCVWPRLRGIEVERDVVIEEILDSVDAHGREIDADTLSRRLLWPGHPLSGAVAGTVERVEAFSEAEVRRHHQKLFSAKNGVLLIAGDVDPAEVLQVAHEAFSDMPSGVRLPNPTRPEPAQNVPIHVLESDDAQVSALLTFPAPHENDARFTTLLLLRRILDDGFASRLRQAVVEQSGLAYSVSASIDAYQDAGALDLEAACAPQKLRKTVRVMLRTLDDLLRYGVCEAELERAKTRHRAELEFGLDDPNHLCGWYGTTELVDCPFSYIDRLRQADSVRPGDIEALADEMFRRENVILTLVGPASARSVETLENMLGRPEDSTLWQRIDEEEEEEEEEETPSVELELQIGDGLAPAVPAEPTEAPPILAAG